MAFLATSFVFDAKGAGLKFFVILVCTKPGLKMLTLSFVVPYLLDNPRAKKSALDLLAP
jgi:hypothetical protein